MYCQDVKTREQQLTPLPPSWNTAPSMSSEKIGNEYYPDWHDQYVGLRFLLVGRYTYGGSKSFNHACRYLSGGQKSQSLGLRHKCFLRVRMRSTAKDRESIGAFVNAPRLLYMPEPYVGRILVFLPYFRCISDISPGRPCLKRGTRSGFCDPTLGNNSNLGWIA